MNATFGRLVVSKFTVWVLAAVVGSYFLVSIKTPEHGQTKYSSLLKGDYKSFIRNLYLPRIKLGIDLQGGTYFVLGVGVEKAIENKLGREQKALDALIAKDVKGAEPKAAIKDGALTYTFTNETHANEAYYLIKKQSQSFAATQDGNLVIVRLNAAEEGAMRNNVVDQAVNVLTNRLNGFGVSGLIVQRHGEHQVVVQLPGVSDPARVKALITQTAMLEFKIVEKSAYSKEELLDAYDGDLPSYKMIIPGGKDDNGHWYLVSSSADMTGDHIVDARVSYDMGRLQVAFSLDGSGATHFKRLTGDNIGKQLGIVIDDVMYSAPTIESAIGAHGTITGRYTAEEARDLALVLRSGSLMAPLSFEQENRVGASLGQDSIDRGLLACLIGLLLVLLFSIVYYRVLGFLATLALGYNLFLILLFLSYFESTLTLPGIAGMVLTIGMAIDSSILIYEGIREDLARGMAFRQALDTGFKGATGVILDSNITTFLAGLILFKFGGPAVRGFAVTLMAGILATLAAGIFFLRALIEWVADLIGGDRLNI